MTISAFGTIIFVFKRYLLAIEFDQTAIGYGDPMGVPSEILKDCGRSSERPSGIDIPIEFLQ